MRDQTVWNTTLKIYFLLGLMLPLLAACGRDAAPRDVPSLPSRTVDVPDFDLLAYQGEDTLGGRETQFSNVFAHGKPVVLNFWAGLCPPCRAEMPSFQAVADDYADEVIIIGVDVGPFIGLGNHDDAQQLLHELGIRYPAAAAVDVAPLRLYEVHSMPTTIFFAPNGEIVEKRAGLLLETHLRESIEGLVAPAQ